MSSQGCPECGAEIHPAPVGRPPIYCCAACRQRAHRARLVGASFAAFDRDASVVTGLKDMPIDEMHDIADSLKECHA